MLTELCGFLYFLTYQLKPNAIEKPLLDFVNNSSMMDLQCFNFPSTSVTVQAEKMPMSTLTGQKTIFQNMGKLESFVLQTNNLAIWKSFLVKKKPTSLLPFNN